MKVLLLLQTNNTLYFTSIMLIKYPVIAPLMKVGLVQSRVSSNPVSNLEKTLHGIEKAAKMGADVVCLQELFLYPYFATSKSRSTFRLAEEIPGPTTDTLGKAARQHRVVLVGGSVFEKSGREHFNTSVVFDRYGDMLGRYRKVHIPDDPHYWENYYFKGGNLGYQVFDAGLTRFGVLICYDQWFPEAARAATLKGAEMLFYPTAIGWKKSMRVSKYETNAAQRWIDVQRGHAIANGIHVAAVNRWGQEKHINFWGLSFIADPQGQLVKMARPDRDEIIVANCDPAKVKAAREWRFLENRRPDTYRRIADYENGK